MNGHPTLRLPNTTNITFHGLESEALLLLLDQEGICASSGSACLADSDEPSHVVKAMKPETAASRQMVRFSLGMENTMAEVEATIQALRKAVAVGDTVAVVTVGESEIEPLNAGGILHVRPLAAAISR